MNELPFMATENIMMQSVKKGGDRQELHERLRTHSLAAGKRVRRKARPTTCWTALRRTAPLA